MDKGEHEGRGVEAGDHDIELAEAKVRSHGLNEDHAEKLGLEVLSAKESAALGFDARPAIKIPYFDLAGEPTEFYRLRYLGEPTGWAAAVEKPRRYVQPAGTLNEVYLPPVVDWREVAGNPSKPIIITEGEFKAAAATARGFPTVGLGGVDCWRAQKRGIPLLPALASIDWNERPVCVLFDSDAASNPNVTRAQRQLAAALTERGARVSVAALPARDDGGKQGVDDYLLAHTDNDLRATLDAALPHEEGSALWEMNEEVVYIRDPGLILLREDGRRMAPSHFKEHAFSNRHYLSPKQTKTGVILEKKPLAPRWLAWEARAELARMTYAPGEGPIVGEGRAGEFNTWKGWGCDSVPGDVAPWTALLDHIFQGYPAEREWFERWCAYPIQHPGAKLSTAAVLWSIAQGTGKTFIGELLSAIYGPGNAATIGKADLTGNWNDDWAGRQFVMGDEITGDESRANADKLKSLITQRVAKVRTKYVSAFSIPDRCNYYFTSNHPDAFFMDGTERRYFVHELQGDPLPDEFWTRLKAWRDGGGLSALRHHLEHLDLGDFNPDAKAPRTEALAEMVEDGRSMADRLAVVLREHPEDVTRHLGDVGKGPVLRSGPLLMAGRAWAEAQGGGLDNLTAKGLGHALKRAGIPRKRDEHGMLYILRDRHLWARATPCELAAEAEKNCPPLAVAKY